MPSLLNMLEAEPQVVVSQAYKVRGKLPVMEVFWYNREGHRVSGLQGAWEIAFY